MVDKCWSPTGSSVVDDSSKDGRSLFVFVVPTAKAYRWMNGNKRAIHDTIYGSCFLGGIVFMRVRTLVVGDRVGYSCVFVKVIY